MNRRLSERQQRALHLLDLVEAIEKNNCSVHVMAFDEKTGASAPVALFHGIAADLQTSVHVDHFGMIRRHMILHAGVRAYTLGGDETAAAFDRRV